MTSKNSKALRAIAKRLVNEVQRLNMMDGDIGKACARILVHNERADLNGLELPLKKANQNWQYETVIMALEAFRQLRSWSYEKNITNCHHFEDLKIAVELLQTANAG